MFRQDVPCPDTHTPGKIEFDGLYVDHIMYGGAHMGAEYKLFAYGLSCRTWRGEA